MSDFLEERVHKDSTTRIRILRDTGERRRKTDFVIADNSDPFYGGLREEEPEPVIEENVNASA